MKQIICLILAGLMLFGIACTAVPVAQTNGTPTDAPIEPVDFPIPEISNYAGFAETLSAKLLTGVENRNLSPISVYLALALVAEGAQGDTLNEMLALLGCKTLEELRGVCGGMLEALTINEENSTLTFANSIWMADREGLQFNEGYLSELAKTYRSEANAVKFGTQETKEQIAAWITENTRGKIELSPDALQFDADTIAVLINTIYLKAAWTREFFEEATESGMFNDLNGEMLVDYMNRSFLNATVYKGNGFLRFSIPLQRVGQMTFVLPDEGTPLSGLLGAPEQIRALLTGGKENNATVNVKLPKFRFQDKLELKEVLESLGMPAIGDFSGMCNADVMISRVLQESYIGVDENGVEAAAYTEVVMTEGCLLEANKPKEIDFFLTRPFLYAIESYDGTLLFVGTVTEPTEAK